MQLVTPGQLHMVFLLELGFMTHSQSIEFILANFNVFLIIIINSEWNIAGNTYKYIVKGNKTKIYIAKRLAHRSFFFMQQKVKLLFIICSDVIFFTVFVFRNIKLMKKTRSDIIHESMDFDSSVCQCFHNEIVSSNVVYLRDNI